ncbi:ABC transporter substrate-binding protein [Teichococcus aerofrigidensis]
MRKFSRRDLMVAGAALPALAALPGRPRAQGAGRILKIGVLADFSGPYRDTSGPTSVACARQAVADLGLEARGITVEILQADHQNKADVGLGIARRWFDQDGVDAVTEVNNSAVALAVANLAQEKDKVVLASGPASAVLTGPQCTTNLVHWTYDTWMCANVVGKAAARAGDDSFFFLTADYSFGHQLERDTAAALQSAGGKVAGSVRFPFPGTTDFSSYLVQAQSSRAKVVALATAGADTVNCVKQAQEFGLTRRQKMLALIAFLCDIHAMGLPAAQGLLLNEAFYWDLNDRTRAFLNRVKDKVPTNWPNQEHAGTYSAVLHYLKAASDLGVAQTKASGRAAIARMKAMPTDDDCFGPGTLRADGRKIHPAYLFQVKRPEESKGPWDYYKLVGTVAAEEAFRPMDQGGCPLVKA